jgi:uncharacterized membrane protein
MTDEIYRALGRLEAGQEMMKVELASLRTDMHGVTALAHQARGGLRILSAVGVIAGVIGGLIGSFFLKLKGSG